MSINRLLQKTVQVVPFHQKDPDTGEEYHFGEVEEFTFFVIFLKLGFCNSMCSRITTVFFFKKVEVYIPKNI